MEVDNGLSDIDLFGVMPQQTSAPAKGRLSLSPPWKTGRDVRSCL